MLHCQSVQPHQRLPSLLRLPQTAISILNQPIRRVHFSSRSVFIFDKAHTRQWGGAGSLPDGQFVGSWKVERARSKLIGSIRTNQAIALSYGSGGPSPSIIVQNLRSK